MHRWVLLGCITFASLYVFPYYPLINNPNENVRLQMTAAIVDDGTYRIDEVRRRWGWTNDAAVYEGRYYSVKAPGTSLLGVPVYWAYRTGCDLVGAELDRVVALWLARVFASIVPFLIFLWWFRKWLDGRVEPLAADVATVAIGLGSMLLGYALLFVSHTTSALVAFGSFMILHRRPGAPGMGPLPALAAGALAGAVTLFEYPGAIATGVLGLYALVAIKPRRNVVFFVLGVVLALLPLLHFQWAAFGHPLRPGHVFVENPSFRDIHHQGVYGANRFHWDAAYTLLFDRASGLFPLFPFAIAAIPGFVLLLRTRTERLAALAAVGISVGTYVGICFTEQWRGGWTIGPRYLAVTMPFLAWAAAHAFGRLAKWRTWAGGGLAVGTMAAGVIASGLPSAYYPHLPEDVVRPLPDLIAVLVAHGFAPLNLLSHLGVWGTASMWPFFAALGGGIAAGAWRLRADGKGLLLAAAVVVLCLLPLSFRSDQRAPVAFITRNWEPVGRDEPAELRARIEREGGTPEQRRELADLYREEGRDREAREAARLGRRP